MLVALLIASGCADQSYVVVRQAIPSPFRAASTFSFAALHFDGLQIDGVPEPAYESALTASQRNSYELDKHDMVARFQGAVRLAGYRLTIVPERADYVVRPTLTSIRVGGYLQGATEEVLTLEVTAPNGEQLDSVLVRTSVDASIGNAATGTRLRLGAENLGSLAAEYLLARLRR